MNLVKEFCDLFPGPDSEEVTSAYGDLIRRYGEEHRRYHTLAHIAYMLDLAVRFFPNAPLEVLLAVWYHDLIYDPKSTENEELSALHAGSALITLGTAQHLITEVLDLIMMTVKHDPVTDNEKILSDLDLAGLGEVPYIYKVNGQLIRQEYSMFSDEEWKAGRIKFLESMLAKDRIFHTGTIAYLYETQAQTNMTYELEELNAA